LMGALVWLDHEALLEGLEGVQRLAWGHLECTGMFTVSDGPGK
jgi:hypothetical protein